jgi:hypothetical protein
MILKCEENAQIKQGKMPDIKNSHKQSHKDARWTQKNNEGYLLVMTMI